MPTNGRSFSTYSYTSLDGALSVLPKRKERSNKYDFGRLLCVCGSEGMAGAAYLCAKAAYRIGAGLVEILTHESNRVILQTLIPEAVVTVFGDEIRDILPSLMRADAIVIGCGLSVTPLSRELMRFILTKKRAEMPLLIDADGLNLLSANPSFWDNAKGAVLTPHMGEMSRLVGRSASELSEKTAESALKLAREKQVICVLKDHRTAVADGSDGVYLNNTGNSGMSTAGSGDVLSGMIGGLLAQSKSGELSAFDAAKLGVYLHGLCGDIAAERMGEYSLMAGDIIDAIPTVLKRKRI